MVRKMNLDVTSRKALAATIGELTGKKVIYRRIPTCNYDIGKIMVTNDGSVKYPDRSVIIERLVGMGFTVERERIALTIEIPNTLNKAEMNGLKRLISSKAALK